MEIITDLTGIETQPLKVVAQGTDVTFLLALGTLIFSLAFRFFPFGVIQKITPKRTTFTNRTFYA